MPARTVTLNIIGDSSKAQKAVRSIADETESAGHRVGAAFTGVLDSVNRTGVLGPFGESVSRVFDAIEERGKGLGKTLMGISGAGVGISAGLIALGGEDQQAIASAKAAVQATGESWAEYGEQFEKAAKSNENFGIKMHDTERALGVLTQGLHDPKLALDDLALATKMAAFAHVPLSDAATDLVRVHEGSTRVLKAYGLQVKDTGREEKELADAQEKQALNTAEMSSKRHITSADLLRQADAAKKVSDATKALSDAQAKQAGGQTFATPDAALEQLSKNLEGQPEARVAGLSGEFDVLKTKVEGAVAAFGAQWGPALLAGNAVIGIVGSGFEIGAAAIGKWGRAARTAATLQEALSGAQEKASIARMRLSTAEIQLTLAEGATEKAAAAEAVSQAKLNSAQAQGAVAAAKLAVAQGRVTKADSEGGIAAAELATAQSTAAVRAATVKEAKAEEALRVTKTTATDEAIAWQAASDKEITSARAAADARLTASRVGLGPTLLAPGGGGAVPPAAKKTVTLERDAEEAVGLGLGAKLAAGAKGATGVAGRLASRLATPLLIESALASTETGQKAFGWADKHVSFPGDAAIGGALDKVPLIGDLISGLPKPEAHPNIFAEAAKNADVSAMAATQAAAIMPAAPAMGAAVSSQAAGGDGGGDITINVPLTVDGRQIAQATAVHTRDELLRLGRGTVNLGMA